jgi:hypothetical protein
MRYRILAIVSALILAGLGLGLSDDVESQEAMPETTRLDDARDDEDTGWDFDEALTRIRAEEAARRQVATPLVTTSDTDLEAELREEVVILQPWFGRHPLKARRVADIIYVAATEHGVDPHIALAYASRESGFRAGATGSLNEQGLLQVMPNGDARRTCDPERRDLSQPRVNADVAMCYYAHLVEYCGTDDPWVIAGAYGTGRCVEPERARLLLCAQRKRAELCRAVGDERCAVIWPT